MTTEEFLTSRCFYCTKLRARLSPECCKARQHAEIPRLEIFKKTIPEEMSANDYCASKKCQQGRQYR